MSNQAADHGHCFLCGVELTDDPEAREEPHYRTREHVFPQWLLRDHDMYRQAMTLPNRTLLTYDKLVIPCCRECNGKYLKPLEDRVGDAFRAGRKALQALDRTDLYLWLAKLYYGLRFRELSLPIDRRNVNVGNLVDQEELRNLSFLHLILQAARGKTDWSAAAQGAGHDLPGSLVVLSAQTSDDTRLNFGYVDSRSIPYIAVRIGPTIVQAVLEDWGEWEGAWGTINQPDNTFPQLFAAKNLDLTPAQFVEFAVLSDHLAQAWDRNRSYMWVGGSSLDEERQLIAASASARRNEGGKFGPEWFINLAAHLAAMTGEDPAEIYNPTAAQQIGSLLCMPDGMPHQRFGTAWDATTPDVHMTLTRVRPIRATRGRVRATEGSSPKRYRCGTKPAPTGGGRTRATAGVDMGLTAVFDWAHLVLGPRISRRRRPSCAPACS